MMWSGDRQVSCAARAPGPKRWPGAGLAARIWNPCHPDLPSSLAEHPAVRSVWEGLDPTQVWDCHVHLAGTGDSGSGIALAPAMTSLLHPIQYVQRLFFLNAGGVDGRGERVDPGYVERLLHLATHMPPGVKFLLLALDHVHDENGKAVPERSAMVVPDSWAAEVARSHPQHFVWASSIHPYRLDAVDALEHAAANGARAVKWLPPAMGIDPASALCDDFYRALARLDLPLVTHGGAEKALHGARRPEFGNPLRLRRALDAGVRVVVAHCAAMGRDADLDNGGRLVSSFELFARMMDDPAHRDHLFGDISAITQINRPLAVVRAILEHDDWHHRLVNGTDYPLPGIMPLFSPALFARAGLLSPDLVPVLNALQGCNPMLFDLVFKRHLTAGGRRLPAGVFASRHFFDQEKV